MKKRTYKRMQNRLYREIKRRMLLEHSLSFPPKVCVEQRKIDTLKVSHRIPTRYDYGYSSEYAKRKIADEFARKLLEDGYILFCTQNEDYELINDEIVIEARLNVVRG